MTAKDNFDTRGKDSLLEKRYIARVLAHEANEIWQQQTRAIDAYGLNESGLMRNSRRWRLAGEGSFYNQHLEIYYVKYLRFHDMKKGGRSLTILGQERATKDRRRQYHIYNRILWGHLNEIHKKLRFGFTEEVKRELAMELNIPIST